MDKEDLEEKAKKALLTIKDKVIDIEKKMSGVLNIDKKVNSIYAILEDLGLKLTHVLEYKLDYHTLPKGIDYEE
jgi:hypothetical protein